MHCMQIIFHSFEIWVTCAHPHKSINCRGRREKIIRLCWIKRAPLNFKNLVSAFYSGKLNTFQRLLMVCAVYNKIFLQFSIFPLGMKLVHAFFFWSFSNKAFLFVVCWLMLYISNYKHYDTLFQSSCRQKKKKRLRFKQFCNPCKSSLF